jgi:predicted chitinase
MSYLENLKPKAKENALILLDRMKAKGITNPYSQAGIMAVVSKESGFMPRNETSYSTTSNARIRQVFGSRLANYTEAQLDALKKDDVAFYDAIYGMTTKVGKDGGNNQVGDGYKYRGRGFNGVTFKGAYKKYGDLIGVDLVSNPDKLNDVEVASDVLIAYFKNGIVNLGRVGKLPQYNAKDINDFKTTADSVGAFYHINAGVGQSMQHINADVTGGKGKAEANVGSIFDYIKTKSAEVVSGGVALVKKKPLTTVILTSLLIVSGYLIYKYGIKKQKI